ncbi:PRMT5 arginine-N-methyltransferase-domain-containing protein [Syncephalastrum racemosum]|uniref:Protein arginine N-methyltransferase n=1 Tax=Syncephalastrum racemosum TaxID=13706 RepID=A0A1X2HMR4_SYNRA|nr:PRMT5 arginine-N-methyltransferase-domain-containing protein [Syncephalastrum racemosum]
MDSDGTRPKCPRGLLTNDYYDNIETFISAAYETGHDFLATPIVHPKYGDRVNGYKGKQLQEWRARPVYDRDDLILKKAQSQEVTLGLLSKWLKLDSKDADLRVNSEIALRQEIQWACHLGLFAVATPCLPSKGSVANLARVLNHAVSAMSVTQLFVHVKVADVKDLESNRAWKQWNKLRNLTEHNPKIGIILELTFHLPKNEMLLDMWLAEPVKAIIIPAEIFVSNPKGYPVLKKSHQAFVKKLMEKTAPYIALTIPPTQIHPMAVPNSYCEYINFLNNHLSKMDPVEQFAFGYQDFLQNPLQPLMDNLDNSMYATFESDPIKYQEYENAVYHALLDRVKDGSDYESVVMVVGAGRGPLVNCCLRAADRADRKIHVYAVEKNPNAFVTLQNAKAETWHDQVTLVFADMRKWKPERQCDILVSELLGSFGDNELSPECLDGAQKFLKPDGISIPCAYTAYVSPMASSKLYNEVASYKDLTHFETPYVVMFQKTCELAPSKPVWTFEHPNPQVDGEPTDNLHNVRFASVDFQAGPQDMIMHGIAGYFEAQLYKNVMISIHPQTHSPGMFSWFPIFFPIRTPLQVPAHSNVSIQFWRATDEKKVWYEWSASVENDEGDVTADTPIHNVGGRSYWVGL